MNHKIKINNIEVELTEEQIIELHSRLQNKGEEYFFPKSGDIYYALEWNGIACFDHNSQVDEEIVARGTFRTKEQAKKEDEKRLALVRMWKYVQENGLFFEPDFKNETQNKYFTLYDYFDNKWIVDVSQSLRYNFLFPYFKTKLDCQKFIDNNLSDLNLFV